MPTMQKTVEFVRGYSTTSGSSLLKRGDEEGLRSTWWKGVHEGQCWMFGTILISIFYLKVFINWMLEHVHTIDWNHLESMYGRMPVQDNIGACVIKVNRLIKYHNDLSGSPNFHFTIRGHKWVNGKCEPHNYHLCDATSEIWHHNVILYC